MTKPVTESAASETLKPQNKSQMLGAALAKMAGLSIEDLSHYLNDTLAQVGHEGDAIPGGASSKNQGTLAMHPSDAVKEDLALILGDGEDLSEEIKTKTATLFEAALETRLIIEREELIEEMNTKLEEAYVAITEEVAEKVNIYLDTVVESWLAENEVAIESALRNEITEDFLEGMKKLFAEHYFSIPEEKVEVVEELADKVAELSDRLDTALVENASLKNTILEAEKNDVVNSVCEGLALTQSEKLRALCESVEFDGNLEAYSQKVNLLKEGVVGNKTPSRASTGLLVEESDPNAGGNAPAPVLDPTISRYVQSISRGIRK